MKKSAALLLVALMVLAPACGTAPAETEPPEGIPSTEVPPETVAPEAPEGKPVIAVVLPALDNPLMLEFQRAFTETFGAEYDVQVASAEGNAITQATQVENYTAMGAQFMFVMAVEASSLIPSLIAAREAGVTVLVAGGDPGEPDAYDAVMMMNQFFSGEYAALMACRWVEATYPDAAPGSIQTAIFVSTLNPPAVERSAGLQMISEPYLKDAAGAFIDETATPISDAEGTYLPGFSEADRVENPAYCPAVNVVQVVQAEMFQAGQTAMQNILTTNPDVRLVLAYAGDGGMGASQAIMDEFAKGPGISVIDDLSQVAVFGVGMLGAEGPAVADSSLGNGVFRGTVRFGGDLIGRTMQYAGIMIEGDDYPKIIWDALDLVTSVDGQLMAQPVPDGILILTVPTAEAQELILPGPPPG
jgi:ABC-type sugar transport system substrate-binding protein